MKKKILYCIIPYFGDEYTIVYSNENRMYSQSTLRGYGKLIGDIPDNCPVIVWKNYNKWLNLETSVLPKEENSAYTGTLNGYLSFLKEEGVTVLPYCEYIKLL